MKTWLLTVVALLGSISAYAQSFEVDGIYYNMTSDATVEVTFRGSSSSDYDDEYSGDIIIPSTVTYSGKEYSVTSIGQEAFDDCDGLTSISIPSSVTSIGNQAFAGTGLTEINVSEGNPVYDSREGCNAIIETASNTLLYGCKNTIIPNSVTSLGDYAFYYCTGLTSINIPNSITSIGTQTFVGCHVLAEITVANDNPVYDSREGCNAIIHTASNTLICGCENTIIPNTVTSIGNSAFSSRNGLTSITIPDGVTSIGSNAFIGCAALTSISIPNSVTNLGDFTFYYCTGLTSINIPDGVTIIGSGTFGQCYSLTSVTIPNSVTSIGWMAFEGCSGLKSVTIGSGVTSIGYNAFRYCDGLQDVYCYAENVPETDANAFDASLSTVTLYVPEASVDKYQSSSLWSGFGSIEGISNIYNLNVSSLGYATLYLNFNTELPAGVEAYVATEVVDSRLKMQKVEGVLPANTGVIIVAGQGTYTFTESDETPATIEKNLLQGSVANTFVTAEANTTYYVLSAPDGDVAMYRALITDGKFLNNAHKAYLPISNGDLGIFDDEVDSSVEQLSRRLVFDFGDETGIDEVKTENANVKTAVYDLSGRRVQKAQKGICIQNGKLMVK